MSSGNREYFELDSIWNFYNTDGQLIQAINYRADKKNGYSLYYDFYYTKDSTKIYYPSSKELFLNGSHEGLSYFYDQNKFLKYTYNYKFDKRSGEGKEYTKDSTIITLFNYYNGYLIETTKINRKDQDGLKQGKWVDFHLNGNKKIESNYLNDKLHGSYKEFDISGKLIAERRYINGEIYIPRVEEEVELKAEIKKSYYPDGTIQYEGAFINNIPVGIHKEFDPTGKLITNKEYSFEGKLQGEGKFDENGLKTGEWKIVDQYFDYYYGKGNYENGKKEGKWVFYFQNGDIEQEGYFNNDKPDQDWIWFYSNGKKKREEVYLLGKREGPYVEYDTAENVILKGEYYDGDRTGEWFYQIGDNREIGSYELGNKNGEWKHYYSNIDQLRFVGSYNNGDEDGTHKWFYANGNVELIGDYRVGQKIQDWKKYNEDGSAYMTFTYRNNELIKIDGRKLIRGKGGKK
jgi:antitoxin component YwqK of YwqJK toxin-antitoxin module